MKGKKSQSTRYVPALFVLFALLVYAPVSSAQVKEQINLNTATVEELMRLPHIGRAVANRILEYRRKHGAFKRPQDIIVIKGLSAKRYREIAHLIRI